MKKLSFFLVLAILFSLCGFAQNVVINSSIVTQDNNFTGRGNQNEVILKTKLTTSGTQVSNFQTLKISLEGTTQLSAIENIKLYNSGNVNKFDPRNPDAVLLGSALPSEGEIEITLSGELKKSTNYLWLCFDIAENAGEGEKVDAQLISVTTENQTYNFTNGNPEGSREILLRRTLVFAPGDYSSVSYRIPAIITAEDGSLVALTDKRKYNSNDLPEDIDIVCIRSIDGGKTWTDPLTIAQGTGVNQGFGDACLIKTNSGKLIALFVGGVGLWNSTAANPQKHYMSSSTDNGLTWTPPVDITNQLYGSACSDPVRKYWNSSFFGSGRGLCLRDGRIMAAIAVRETLSNNILNNYVVYSDDEGETWNVSNKAISAGDEAKLVELNDGPIIISSRTAGNRLWAVSDDRGINWGAKNSWTEIWGNACNGEIMRYTSTPDGFEKNRILHTLPNASNRTNVSIWISYDETQTWPVRKTLCEGASAYSSVTILPDGTIGVYLEEDETVPYKMYFLNFSLDWLSNGADEYLMVGAEVVSPPEFSLPSGNYCPPQTLNITCETLDADIYYTIDGSTPNSNSLFYSEPVVLNESCTVKAIAIKQGMANSVITSANYTIGYMIPGQLRPVGNDRYLTQVFTENGISNINYTANQAPESHYIFHDETFVSVNKNESFSINIKALPGQSDGMQFCQAIILIDWNANYSFRDDGERIAIYGLRKANNSASVMNISREITVSPDAELGKTRIRIVYTDAWRPDNFEDFGDEPVDKGRIYDFEIEVLDNVGIESVKTNKFFIENPVKDNLNIQIFEGEYQVEVFDTIGKKVLQTYLTEGQHSLPVNHLKQQVFVVKIIDKDKKVFSNKIVRE